MTCGVTPEHFNAILKQASASKPDKDGWEDFPENTTVTFYVAHGGAPLTVPRVEAVRIEGDLVYARTQKKDLFCLVRTDVMVVALEGSIKQVARRAGFG